MCNIHLETNHCQHYAHRRHSLKHVQCLYRVLIFFVAFATSIMTSEAEYLSTKVNGSYPMILPRATTQSAVGYDAANDTILILGGKYFSLQFVTFKNGLFVDYGSDYFGGGNIEFAGNGQYYTQMGDTLWYINCVHGKLVTFDTLTYKTFDPNITIPISIVIDTNCNPRSCLASLNNGHHQYLFVIGFDALNWFQSKKVQIY
eukprot:333939_1